MKDSTCDKIYYYTCLSLSLRSRQTYVFMLLSIRSHASNIGQALVTIGFLFCLNRESNEFADTKDSKFVINEVRLTIILMIIINYLCLTYDQLTSRNITWMNLTY